VIPLISSLGKNFVSLRFWKNVCRQCQLGLNELWLTHFMYIQCTLHMLNKSPTRNHMIMILMYLHVCQCQSSQTICWFWSHASWGINGWQSSTGAPPVKMLNRELSINLATNEVDSLLQTTLGEKKCMWGCYCHPNSYVYIMDVTCWVWNFDDGCRETWTHIYLLIYWLCMTRCTCNSVV
jgi:hypothetical protein